MKERRHLKWLLKNTPLVNLPDLSVKELNHLLGNIDIYLLDQILKGRFPKSHKILDAGCGEGRNLIYFIRNNYHVYGIDKNEDSINMLKYLAKAINSNYPPDRLSIGDVNDLPYQDQEFDSVISSAVIHFAENEFQFNNQFTELIRILKAGGTLFVRMATIIGIEALVKPLGEGKYLLPDGSVRFLLTRALLKEIEDQFEFIDPLKVVLVDNQRCMCTMVLKKPN